MCFIPWQNYYLIWESFVKKWSTWLLIKQFRTQRSGKFCYNASSTRPKFIILCFMSVCPWGKLQSWMLWGVKTIFFKLQQPTSALKCSPKECAPKYRSNLWVDIDCTVNIVLKQCQLALQQRSQSQVGFSGPIHRAHLRTGCTVLLWWICERTDKRAA